MSNDSKVLVASDQHLGYQNSNSQDFGNFLDEVSNRNDVETLVILGDFIDMWRRDVSGLFLENSRILDQVLALKLKIKVYVIAGNHDYHLLNLLDHAYPFEFLEKLVLDGGAIKYRFVHGWEFDLAQQPPLMEALCHNLSDEAGQVRSDVYSNIQKLANDFKELFSFHGGQDGYINHLMLPPEQRLAPYLTDVENRACSSLNEGEILVFGHTHRPFVSTTGRVVNTGSWVSNAPVHNTYAELDGDQVRLMVYGGSEILERYQCPS